jgi:hypothetical protein
MGEHRDADGALVAQSATHDTGSAGDTVSAESGSTSRENR